MLIAIKIFADHVEKLQPLGEFLSGRNGITGKGISCTQRDFQRLKGRNNRAGFRGRHGDA
jgi:hypothetical protein